MVCLVCGTQSQDYHDEVVERTEIDIQSGIVGGMKILQKKETCNVTYEEGLQKILLYQISTMVKELNFHSSLVDVVGSIWFKYLNDDNCKVYKTFRQRNPPTTEPKAKSKISGIMTERVTLNITLAIIYLGCLCLHEPITIGDLIRWARSGVLPFLSAYKILPVNMKQAIYLKPTRVPKSEVISNNCRDLVEQLKLDIPPMNFRSILRSWKSDLFLPDNIVEYVERLVNRYGFEFTICQKQSPHALLMACVVIVMKLIYGFEDKKTYEPRINISCKNLEAWLNEMMTKLISARIDIPWSVSDLMHMSYQNFKQFIEFCKEHPLHRLERYLFSIEHKELASLVKVNGFGSDPIDYNSIDTDERKKKIHIPGVGTYKAYTRYVIYDDSIIGDYHRSYSFLLCVCAMQIEVKPAELVRAVSKLEGQIFREKGGLMTLVTKDTIFTKSYN